MDGRLIPLFELYGLAERKKMDDSSAAKKGDSNLERITGIRMDENNRYPFSSWYDQACYMHAQYAALYAIYLRLRSALVPLFISVQSDFTEDLKEIAEAVDHDMQLEANQPGRSQTRSANQVWNR